MNEILCITHKYPPAVGGMEKQSFELIKGLSRHYKTHVIAYENKGNKTLWFMQLRGKIKQTLKENPNIRLIHLNDGSMGVACLWLQKYTDIPVVVTFHGLDVTVPLPFFQRYLIPKLRKYAGAVCVSDFTRQQCLQRGFDGARTVTIRNGVDIEMASIPFDEKIREKIERKINLSLGDKHILVTTGRPVKRKGFSWFLKHVMPLLDKNIVLLMIGPMSKKPTRIDKWLPGKLGHTIQLILGLASDAHAVSEELATQPNAFHLGKVSYNDLVQTLSLADIFVMPNITVPGDEEGFGLVALEACMREALVLASGIEGITDAVIDGKNGFLLPSGDAEAWCKKIHQILSDKERMKTLSQEFASYTKAHYSWDIMVENYKKVFDSYM